MAPHCGFPPAPETGGKLRGYRQFDEYPGERVAIIAGLRTPFARQLTAYKDLNAIDLGVMVTNELLSRINLDPALIERMVYGCVGLIPEAPNVAREVLLGAG